MADARREAKYSLVDTRATNDLPGRPRRRRAGIGLNRIRKEMRDRKTHFVLSEHWPSCFGKAVAHVGGEMA